MPILSSIKQTQLITCSINFLIRDYLEKRPSELAIIYNVRGNYMTFFKSLLFLPVSRCQKHPDTGEAVSIERVKLICEECGIIRRIHLKN